MVDIVGELLGEVNQMIDSGEPTHTPSRYKLSRKKPAGTAPFGLSSSLLHTEIGVAVPQSDVKSPTQEAINDPQISYTAPPILSHSSPLGASSSSMSLVNSNIGALYSVVPETNLPNLPNIPNIPHEQENMKMSGGGSVEENHAEQYMTTSQTEQVPAPIS